MDKDAGRNLPRNFNTSTSQVQEMATEITMLRNPSSTLGCSLKEGETGVVEDSLAGVLVGLSIAIAVSHPETIKAIPDSPTIAGVEPDKTAVESATEQPRKRR